MTEILKSKCLRCGTDCDRVTGTTREGLPRPGDVSICGECGAMALFDEVLKFRKPSQDELWELMSDPNLAVTINAIRIAAKTRAARRN